MPMHYDPAHETAMNNIMKDIKGADPAKMFGMPCYKVNGKMIVGLHEAGVVVKVGQKRAQEMIAAGEAQAFEPMPGRLWKEWILLTENFDQHKKLFKDAVDIAKKAV